MTEWSAPASGKATTSRPTTSRFDTPDDLGPVREAVAGRRVFGIACTHGHSNHVRRAVAASAEFGAPTMLQRLLSRPTTAGAVEIQSRSSPAQPRQG